MRTLFLPLAEGGGFGLGGRLGLAGLVGPGNRALWMHASTRIRRLAAHRTGGRSVDDRYRFADAHKRLSGANLRSAKKPAWLRSQESQSLSQEQSHAGLTW